MEYLPRIIDAEVRRLLEAVGAVVIEGPKACGKTATGLQLAASSVRFDTDAGARSMVSIEPGAVLDGPTPRLLDEWQVVPELWNHLRHRIDDRQGPGQFILTGSAVPADDITRHSGAGRIGRLRMRPMSLFESGSSEGLVSLAVLLAGERPATGRSAVTITDLADLICAGGWPGLRNLETAAAGRAVSAYLDEVARTDASQVNSVRRDPQLVKRLLHAVARNVSTQASARKIAADTTGPEAAMHDDTVRDYLSALERLMVIEDQPAWSTHLRSRATLRTSPTRHFVDPSLAAAALGASPATLLRDGETFGFLFESLVIRDLRIYAQALDGEVFHYRDNVGTEVDAIISLRDGRWGAIEVKLGETRADEAAASLNRFLAKVDTSKVGQPAFVAIITGGSYAYVRPDDGIAVIPLGLLGP